jgi:hypothetical protein
MQAKQQATKQRQERSKAASHQAREQAIKQGSQPLSKATSH